MTPSPTPATAAAPSKADAFVVSCIDPRLVDDVTHLMDSVGRAERYSEMRIAGAALAAVDPARPAWSQALWENLAASRQLHGVRKVVFVNHRDCGAMDLFAGRRLAADRADEQRQHQAVLDQAAAAVLARHPDMQVELRLMELDGRSTLMPCAACAARPPLRAEAVAPPPGFTELVRLRLRDGPLTPEAERALLAEGIGRHGLTLEAARATLAA
ncbi:carbonic anhydrase, partial [Falsiroseomonas selenitidurans]